MNTTQKNIISVPRATPTVYAPVLIPVINKIKIIPSNIIKIDWSIDWEEADMPYPEVKIPPTKNNKPHWRENRILYREDKFVNLWRNITKFVKIKLEYREHQYPTATQVFQYMKDEFTSSGCRIVYDIQYSSRGIHFEHTEDLIAFILKWS